MTDLEKKKQSPTIYLSLEGQARQCCANVSEQKQTLARATISKLTFEDMKKQCKAIFDQQAGSLNLQEYRDVPVKVEPTYHSQNVQNDSEEKSVLFSKIEPRNS